MTVPKILNATWPYFQKFLVYHGLEITPMFEHAGIWGGDQQKVSGFTDYNFLLDINRCFSNRPGGLVRDITGTVKFPFLTEPGLLWQTPVYNPSSLENCFFERVKQIEQQHQVVNLMWSGGIDSTAMVVAWLQYADQNTHIRIMYSIDSIKENTDFFMHLQTVDRIELVEIGGTVFYNNEFDGVEITGGGGDDITASVDQSFFEKHGWRTLQSKWQDFFWKQHADQNFIDFCERWFSASGREISTVLEARWWMYLNKLTPSVTVAKIVKKQNPAAISFFSDPQLVAYFYYRIDALFPTMSWHSYKQDFKNFIYKYHPDKHYQKNKCKVNSGGYKIFGDKSAILTGQESICVLSNLESIRTDHLPFLSKYEYRKKYGNSLDYLFEHA
jgi:hypothetical protein